ncbi:hypothetical protein FE79_14835, partial [Staphylococcus aureus]
QSGEADLNQMKNDMSKTDAIQHGEKDDKNDEAMEKKALEKLNHLNQQIDKSKDASEDTSEDTAVSTPENNHEVDKQPNKEGA